MPVPKRKTSKRRRDQRHSCKFIRPQAFSGCSECGVPGVGHQVCASCGFYKGKKVMVTKLDRMVKRTQLRQAQDSRRAARNANSSGADAQGSEGAS